MQLNYWKNILPPVDGMQKISSICWSANGRRMAVVGSDRVVQMFNESGEKKDKFPTKASEKGQSYIVRCMEFSPDSSRIAIAQSDNIVFVYKIGLEWGDKKSICNKFPTSSSVTALCWPRGRQNNSTQTDLVYGLAEGKVKLGVHRNNKSQQLYQTDSYVVSLTSNREGTGVISGHLDGSIYYYNFDSQQAMKVKVHHSVPYALVFGEQIVAAGSDQKVSFYDLQGNTLQRFDYSHDEKCKDFSCAGVNPSGDSVVLGNYNRFYMYQLNKRRGQWEEIGIRHIDHYYTVTAVSWKLDGSKLVIGSLCGSVDGFDLSLKKVKYKGKFEFNYVSPSQVVVKTIMSGSRVAIKTELAPEIQRVNVLQDRYIVAHTAMSLLLGDLETGNLSEIPWRGSGKEKFDFSNPGVSMVSNSGELTLVEFGSNEPLGNCRTEFVKPSLVSVRISQNMKVVAFLLDQQTIRAINLANGGTIAQVTSESKIEYLELSIQGNKLIFRDKKKQLHLFDFKTQQRNTLLNYCQFAQWIPESEVIVAQNRSNLCVWYSVMNPDKVTIYRIKGDVEDIIRSNNKTEVLVNEAQGTVVYELEEPLIQFGFCVETRDLEKAANILDPLDINEETEANWKTLARISLEEENLQVAEHCYAALGDIAKARYLRGINKLIMKIDQEQGQGQGIRNYRVRAKLAVLDKQYHQAEAHLLAHDEVEEAMDMYQTLHKWDEAIKIAEKKNIPDVVELKKNYFDWLLDSNQEGKAGEIKEQEGELMLAVDLYLKGGMPALAANVVFNYDTAFPQDILERIALALSQSGMQERAGEFYEQMEQLQKALDCYCKGNAFHKALELAKRSEPRLVQQLEEKWGDWLHSQRQTENSINHYIEANCFQKAIEAAITARQWNRASQLLQGQSPEVARPYYRQIAKHYSESKQYDLAEKYYLKAGMPIESFEVYINCGKWESALRVARENLPESEVQQLLVRQGEKLEHMNNWKEAERLYLLAEQAELAIRMYKQNSQWDNMIRLVSRYRREQLYDTHMTIGAKLEAEGNLKLAEQHFVEGQGWQSAVDMYRNKQLWEEAIRVCKHNGSDQEVQELAKRWAEVLGPQQSIKMLLKHNLVEAVVEYMMDRKQYEEAFKMCQQHAKHKMADVHLKLALQLEDERRFKEAEEHFVKAGRPAEAINMYEHQTDFQSALAVARQYDPSNLPQVLINQAKYLVEKKQDYVKAESCYVQSRKPELAVRMYLQIGSQAEALRVAKKHCPHLVNELNKNKESRMAEGHGGQLSGEEIRNSARLWEESRDYNKAIDTYLELEKESLQDQDQLEECWERAVQLALNFQRDRAQDVVRIVSKRLKDISRYEAAAELLENVGLVEEAVHFYLNGNLFERAKQCASQVKNPEINQRLSELINKVYKGHLKGTNQAEEMINQGDYQQGLEMFAENNQWEQCLDNAQRAGREPLNRFLMKFAKITMESGKFNETIQAFSEYGIQNIPQNYAIYKTLFLEIFVESDDQEIFQLRNCLGNLVNLMEQQNELGSPAGKEFYRYLQVAHFANLKNLYQKEQVQPLLSRMCVSLLRYSNLIRLDKVYYEAGINCKKQDWLGFAILLINRYLDIYDVIEDQDANTLGDNSEYQTTDIPSPYDCPLPNKNLLTEPEKEKIKNWCLNILFDSKVTQQFPTRNCEFCNVSIYEPSLKCYSCKSTWEPCIVTGYPIVQNNKIHCKSCRKPAIREYFNIYLQNFANCPWCNQSPN